MKIRVRYIAQARQAAKMSAEVLEFDAAISAQDVLRRISDTHGVNIRRLLLDERGEIHTSLLIFVNGQQLAAGAALILNDGDEMELVPPMSGG